MERKIEVSDKKMNGLRRFNLIMGFFHLIQGVLMIVLSNDTTYPVYTNFLTFNMEEFRLMPEQKLLFENPFGIATGVFLLLSAVAHFSLGTFGFKWYAKNIRNHQNPARYVEYSLSSAWMIVLIGQLTGIWDAGALLAMFGLTAVMNLFGLLMETMNKDPKKTNWSPFWFGSIAGIIPWIMIVWYFVGSIAAAPSADAKPPAFVYAIVPTLFVFFNTFAVNMYLQYKKVGKWKDYVYGERMFIILSLAAKTFLAWFIFAGTLAPV
jgi:hypothetical protein